MGCFIEDGVFEFDGWVIWGWFVLCEYVDVYVCVVWGCYLIMDFFYEVDGDVVIGCSVSVVILVIVVGYKIFGLGEY